MMAWAVCIVPMSVGMAVFAEVAGERAAARTAVASGTRTSLLVGTAAAVTVAAAAPLALSLLGPGYAGAGTGPLRVLVISVLPLTVLQVYFALCRASGRMAEAIATGAAAAVLGVGAAAIVAPRHGLTGMAVAWVLTQSAVALWAGLRQSAPALDLREVAGVGH
jgi:O-antigen/teichoic acid export membrane protein